MRVQALGAASVLHVLLTLIHAFHKIESFAVTSRYSIPRLTNQDRENAFRIQVTSAFNSNSDYSSSVPSELSHKGTEVVPIEIEFFRQKLERDLVRDTGDVVESTSTLYPQQRQETLVPGSVTGSEEHRRQKLRFHRNGGVRTRQNISALFSNSFLRLVLKKSLLSVALLAILAQRGALSLTNFAGISGWYVTSLKQNPIVTKALTTCVMALMGDALAQKVERKKLGHSQNKHSFRRSSAMMVDGLYAGPCMHFAYGFFETIIPTVGRVGLMSSLAAISHCVADTLFMDTFFIGTMFISSGLVEGLSFWNEIIPQLKKDYIPAIKAGVTSSTCLMPLEFFIFRFVPITFRPLAVSFLDVIWNGVVSFMLHKNRNNVASNEEDDVISNGNSAATLA